jgi:hypothetical protein
VLNRKLDSGALAAAITSQGMRDRVLGFTKTMGVVPRCVWLVTGNNVTMSQEMIRRSIYIRLDANLVAPHLGRTFRHVLPRWAKLNRGKLVTACLTICQAWFAAGKPHGRRMLGGFDSWSVVLDGILANAGIEDFMGNRSQLQKRAGEDLSDWKPFINAWWEAHRQSRVLAGQLYTLAVKGNYLDSVLKDGKNEQGQRSMLGNALRKKVDNVFDLQGAVKLIEDGEDNSSRPYYRLVKLDTSGEVVAA